jgi:hypothetical protein
MTIRITRQLIAIHAVLFGMLLLAHASETAVAQQSADPMEACFQMTDPAARFTCYDHEMQRRHAAVAPASIPGTTSLTTATQAPIDDTIGLDGKQLSLKRKEEGLTPEPVQPIVAALAALKQRPGHMYYFELDNGQVWESTDTVPELFLGPHETVRIRPGVLGAFFLKTQEGNSIRVHRVR